MLKFMLRLLAVLAAALLLFSGIVLLSALPGTGALFTQLSGSEDFEDDVTAEATGHLVSVQSDPNAHSVILGDSVCWQVFAPFGGELNPNYRVDGYNAGASMAGQLLLAQAFLETHPDATDLYLFMTPKSMNQGFADQMTYVYMARPFGLAGLLEQLDDQTRQELREYYGLALDPLCLRLSRSSNLVNKLVLNRLKKGTGYTDAQGFALSLRCLEAIRARCEAQGVAFHFLSTVRPDLPEQRESMAALEQRFREEGIYDTYADYFTKAVWYDPAYAGADGVHIDFSQATVSLMSRMVELIRQQTGLLGDFNSPAE